MARAPVAREAPVRGALARWRVAGEGPPLLFLHGLSGSWRWWEPALPWLADRWTCHLLDLPRLGRALRPDETPDWVLDWTAAAGVERLSLVGYSLSGIAATQVAARRPDLVESLVLVAPVGMPSGRGLAGYAVSLATTAATTTPRFLARLTLDALRTGPAALVRGGLYASQADIREEARAVRAPTLLLWGDRDPVVPAALAGEWLRAMPSARLVLLPGARHVPQYEQPEAFARALCGFLGSVAG